MSFIGKAAIVTGLVLSLSGAAIAQEEATTTAATTSVVTPSETATSSTTTGTTSEEPTEFDSRRVREQFYGVLERHPREVGMVLKLDPTLFRNEAYMASYPALQAFVKAHPEVAQTPSYFLDHIYAPGEFKPDPPAVRAWNQMAEGLAIFAVFSCIALVLSWLIRTVIDHRRWSRVAKVQTEMHNKLLDRFTSHEDLLRYIESSGGKKFLDTAIIPPVTRQQPSGSPVSRMLWAVQAGVVAAAIGIGIMVVSARAHADISAPIFGIGIIALFAGGGFILSGVIGYVMSRRLGLLNEVPAAPVTTD